jgi:hypothetical protein
MRGTIDPSSAFPDFGAVKVCNFFSATGVSGAGTYQVTVNGVAGTPLDLPNDGQCAVVWQQTGDGQATIKVTQISANCTMHLAVRQLDADGNFNLIVDDGTGTNTFTGTVTTVNGLSDTGFALWFQNGSGGCTPPPQVCTDQAATNFGGPLPCVYPPENTPCPAGSFTFVFVDGVGLHIRYDQFPAPNDNSYGTNAVGWGSHGHKFTDLVGSDHAGFQLVDPGGVVRLSFNVDYISANLSAPSGYASLGVTGGDGKMIVGTADGISATSSLANNLNNINIPGLFNAAHVQQFGSVNLLINSPPTDAGHTTYAISDPTLTGWDFHDTYFVDISLAKLASLGFDAATWRVEPNLSQLHNSPAKACPTSATGGISASKYEVKDKQVKVTILNSGSTNAFVEALANITWPAANGKLLQIKLDGDVLYNVSTAAGPLSLTTAQLPSDPNHRKIDHGSSDVLAFIFEKNASTNLAAYTGSVTVSGNTLVILPK